MKVSSLFQRKYMVALLHFHSLFKDSSIYRVRLLCLTRGASSWWVWRWSFVLDGLKTHVFVLRFGNIRGKGTEWDGGATSYSWIAAFDRAGHSLVGMLELFVAEREQKRIQSRVKVAKHQQHIENFTRVWVPVLVTVENTDNAEIREGLPAKEESCHKHEGCLGCFKVSCIGLGSEMCITC